MQEIIDFVVSWILAVPGIFFAGSVFLLLGVSLLLRWPKSRLRQLYEGPSEFKWRQRAFKPHPELDQVISSQTKVLDIGSGNGFKANEIAKKYGAQVTLCDIGDFNHTDLPLKVFDGVNLPFADKSFDVVMIAFVLHHASDPVALLKEAKRVSRQTIIIYEDNRKGLVARVATKLHGIAFGWIYEANNDCQFYSQSEWENLFKKIGCQIRLSLSRWRTGSITYPVKECVLSLVPPSKFVFWETSNVISS